MYNPGRPFAGLERVDFTGLRMRLIDAENEVLGRLAAHLSVLLQGKDKPTYSPHADGGDICVVINAERAVLTGKRWEKKLYRWHTGFPGGLKEITAKEMWRRDPAQLLHGAVAGMLPKNNLRPARLRKLRVFTGPDHPFEGVELVPWAPPPRVLQDRGLGWLLPDGLEPMNPDAYVRRMRGSRLLRGAPPLTLPRGSNGADDVMAQLRKALAAQRDAGAGALLEGGIGGGTDPQLLSFDDLLTEEERAFVASSVSRT